MSLLILSYLTYNIDNIDFFMHNMNYIKNINNNINLEIVIINNINLDLNINKNVKVYKNLNNKNINFLLSKHDFDYLLVTNIDVLFSYNLINWINQVLLENKEDYYINQFINLNSINDKNCILNEDCFNKIISNINYVSDIGNIDNNKLEKFINDYNTKQYLFQYDNLNDLDLLLDNAYNFTLIHKNIINNYGFLINNDFYGIRKTVNNYFNNLKYINILPYVLSIFTVSNIIDYNSTTKIRNILVGNKNEEGIERERKDKKIRQLINENTNLKNKSETLQEDNNLLEKKINDIKEILLI
tara:strand:+ start:182 stop:1081 length:900 start_codon:yes stop_codon:yes gene_type:complete